MGPQTNSLYYGDCLEVMRNWPAGTFDLVYLDPPFNSKANYNILFGSRGTGANRPQVLAFEDTWHWDDKAAERVAAIGRATLHPAHQAIAGLHAILGECGMLAYVSYMANRLAEIKRVLKETGSIYLHCDPTASHYLKIVMDAVFGQRNFRNEIVWKYGLGGSSKRLWSRKHDVILFYTVSNEWYFDKPQERATSVRMAGEMKGVVDVWDIPSINNMSKERLGYPTQKPLALLERVVKASSSDGALVLDPFCGCGTTIDAAKRLGRNWVGIDISPFAIDLVKYRRLRDRSVPVHGVPVDIASAQAMATETPFEFEKWAVSRIPGIVPNSKQVGDRGIDGRGRVYESTNAHGLVLVQIKGGRFNLSHLRDFLHTVQREEAELGIFVTVDKVTSRDARAETQQMGTVRMGAKIYPKVQLWSIAEHFDDREPKLPPLADPYTGGVMNLDLLTDRVRSRA